MTTVAVIGATGAAGSRVTDRLKAHHVAVVEASGTHGIDLLTGEGLLEALTGVDIAIDVSDPTPTHGCPEVAHTLTAVSRNIVGACAAGEVQRLVLSTLACIDDPAFDGVDFYETKRRAREILRNGPIPTTIVKSTHCYEVATSPDAVTCTDDEVVVEDWLIQPIAADTVADVLVEAALGQTHKPHTITGPHSIRLPELTSKLLAQQGDRRPVRTVQPAAKALAAGALLASNSAVIVGPDVDTWLHTLAPASANGHHADGDAR